MAWRSVIAVGQVIRQYGLASEILTPREEFGSGRKSMGDLIVKLITRYIQMYFIFIFHTAWIPPPLCIGRPAPISPLVFTCTAAVSFASQCFL